MSGKRQLAFELNGEAVDTLCQPRQSLLEVLRDELRLTGTKEGCNDGNCGACSVTLDGVLVNACCVLALSRSAAPVPVAEYSLAFCVPDADIQAPAETVKELVYDITLANVLVFAIVAIVGLGAFYCLMKGVVQSVVRPVNSLREVIEAIIKDKADREAEFGDDTGLRR